MYNRIWNDHYVYDIGDYYLELDEGRNGDLEHIYMYVIDKDEWKDIDEYTDFITHRNRLIIDPVVYYINTKEYLYNFIIRYNNTIVDKDSIVMPIEQHYSVVKCIDEKTAFVIKNPLSDANKIDIEDIANEFLCEFILLK